MGVKAIARPLRIEYPGAFYHVTARGVAGQAIFLADEDRQRFVQRLAELRPRWGLIVHAYCLMPNHYHVEIETPEGNLSRAMQWFNQVFAAWVNWRHDRAGHLFQGRFKSALIQADAHLHALTRYIHLNPVRAGMCAAPGEYSWSSYRAYIGLMRRPSWLEVGTTLDRFGTSAGQRTREYRRFVEGPGAEDPLEGLGPEAILGSREFVASLLEKLRGPDGSPRLEAEDAPPDLARICALVGECYGTDEARCRERARKGNESRDIGLYLSREVSRRPHAEIGAYSGGVGTAAVSMACRRVDERLRGSVGLRRKVERLAQECRSGPPPSEQASAPPARV